MQRLLASEPPHIQTGQAVRGMQAVADAMNGSPQVRRTQALSEALNAPPLQRAPDRTGLGTPLKQGLESLSGVSLDDVRVHRGSALPASVGAHAVAQANAIHLAPGQDRHLAHEAWHVVQQKQGRVPVTGHLATPGGGAVALNDDPALEHEADRMGRRALSAGDTPVQRAALVQSVPGRGVAQAVMQRVIAQVLLDEHDIVNLAIVGRPPNVYGSSAGDHLTAFGVRKFGLKTRLDGQPFWDAVGEMDALIEGIFDLPGYGLVENLPEKQQARLSDAIAQVFALKEKLAANKPIDGTVLPQNVTALQQLIAAYLEAVELVPLSTINTASHSAASAGKGKAEAGPLQRLVEGETFFRTRKKDEQPSDGQWKDWLDAVAGSFDSSAAARAAVEDDPSALAPGLTAKDDVDRRIDLLVRHHLAGTAQSFPLLMQALNEHSAFLHADLQSVVRWQARVLLEKDFVKLIPKIEEDQRSIPVKIAAKPPPPLKSTQRGASKVPFRTATRNVVKTARDKLLNTKRKQEEDEKERKRVKKKTKTEADPKTGGLLKKRRKSPITAINEKLAPIRKKLKLESPYLGQDVSKFVPSLFSSGLESLLQSFISRADPILASLSGLTGPPRLYGPGVDSSALSIAPEIKKEEAKKDETAALVTTTPATDEEEEAGEQEAAAEDTPALTGVPGPTVQIAFAEDGTIAGIDFAGRSPSPFSSTMGAHTTAWVVYLDSLREELTGLTLDQAVRAFGTLRKRAAKSLATFETLNVGGSRKGSEDRIRGDENRANATKTLDAVAKGFGSKNPAARLSALQTGLSALLDFENNIPGMTLEASDTGGKGESKARRVLRDANLEVNKNKGAARQAILGLFDMRSLTQDAKPSPTLTLALLEHHFERIQSAYPAAFITAFGEKASAADVATNYASRSDLGAELSKATAAFKDVKLPRPVRPARSADTKPVLNVQSEDDLAKVRGLEPGGAIVPDGTHAPNLEYLYEDADIYNLLLKGTAGDNVTVVPPVDDMAPDQLNDRLDELAGPIALTAMTLIPLNLGGYHWVGIAVRMRVGQDPEIRYMDPLPGGRGMPGEVRDILLKRFPGADFSNAPRLQQTDATSCGPLTVRNLLLQAAGATLPRNIPAGRGYISELRRSHIGTLGGLPGYENFSQRQSENARPDFFPLSALKKVSFTRRGTLRILRMAELVRSMADDTVRLPLETAFAEVLGPAVRNNGRAAYDKLRTGFKQALIAAKTLPVVMGEDDTDLDKLTTLVAAFWNAPLPADGSFDALSFADYDTMLAVAEAVTGESELSAPIGELQKQIEEEEGTFKKK
ncbi:MAG: DUF4157 domain-containing protein [Rhizomicrobium sp.]